MAARCQCRVICSTVVALGMIHHSFGRHGIERYRIRWHGNALGGSWVLVLGIHPLPPHPCRYFPALPFSGMPFGGNSCHPMPPTSCKSQGLRPTRLHRVLPVPFVLVPTLISITIAYQDPRPTRLHHVLPIPIILIDIIQNILLLPIGTLGPSVSIAAQSPSAHPSIL